MYPGRCPAGQLAGHISQSVLALVNCAYGGTWLCGGLSPGQPWSYRSRQLRAIPRAATVAHESPQRSRIRSTGPSRSCRAVAEFAQGTTQAGSTSCSTHIELAITSGTSNKRPIGAAVEGALPCSQSSAPCHSRSPLPQGTTVPCTVVPVPRYRTYEYTTVPLYLCTC